MVELVITMDDQGRLNVKGPIDQKMVCYGMLELAKEAIHLHHVNSQKLVQPASTIPQLPKLD